MARPHIEPVVDRDLQWKRFDLPGFPKGMHYKMMSFDPETGASTMVVKFEEGYRQPGGWSESAKEIFILEGKIQIAGGNYSAGHYFYVPAGVYQGPMATPKGAIALVMYNDGEPSLIEDDRSRAGANEAKLISVNAYEDIVWIEPTLRPRPAPGCVIKILRYDEETEAMTFLYAMTPGWFQDNVSFHDCVEEGYHIWGTSWMLQTGDLPTGAYFWRPPYINHGPFRCDYGCLGFGRTDSQLINHFHYNPFTTPEQNAAAAVRKLERTRPEVMKWILKERPHQHGH